MTTETASTVRFDRIERAQALMREQGVAAIVVMNHDDYRWFFGIDAPKYTDSRSPTL